MIALLAPLLEVVVEAVVVIDDVLIGAQIVGAGESVPITGIDGVVGAAAGDFALAAHGFNDRGVAGIVHRNFVDARAQDSEGQIGRINFKIFVVAQALDAHADGAGVQLHLRHVIREIQEREAGVLREADAGRADVQGGARATVRPQLVARGQGAVHERVHPIVGAGRLKRHGAAKKTKPGHAAGGIVAIPAILSGGALRGEQKCEQH